MERAKFIKHKGKEILFLDLSDCKPEEGMEAMKVARDLIETRPKKSVLSLTYVKGGKFNRKAVEALKELAEHDDPYDKKCAVVGVEGIQKVIYTTVVKFSRRSLPLFNTIEEAKDWLVEAE